MMEPADYAKIVRALEREPGVSVGARKGFGAGALKCSGKIFAMLTSRGEFVVKLPKARVDELVAAGVGRRFTAGKGREMREWLMVEHAPRALPLAREAQLGARVQ
ncbi:MAG: hypothetical protein ACRD2D_14360 [Terriglobales bacterium]